MDVATLTAGLVVTADEVRARRWGSLGDEPGVSFKLLWEDRSKHSYAGLMRMEPGAGLSRHSHWKNAHHVWVTEGTCRIAGREVGPGSYGYVPVRTPHEIEQAGPDGCSLFYLYVREE